MTVPALSAAARAGIDWITARLGRDRVRYFEDKGEALVELVRADGRRTWFIGKTMDRAVALAREELEALAVKARRK